ncbi:uncharacterized protein BP01DRAFT_387632 [Aspergillus saccharolyticus JOP 1030-1]|uniref:Uncharacterized protein n=1 Tax=Aspergillus saccharolyticus JOP 1030-1 TaxID=1450539 RepID=A0A318Z990_9EURO|nr:hypothetical protein BP01DRAFT_387632 [Aspergillus saccharolyticus JOP 1030-1]PYH40130.1 hypothetical protein BP01DRAFT_387632 [Aspergillus saccharolyticus JOP 1030-1]
MSMASVSLLRQRSKCIKCPRESRIAVFSVATPATTTSLSWPVAATHIVIPDTEASLSTDNATASANDWLASTTSLQRPTDHQPAETTAARDASLASSVVTATADSLSAFIASTSYLPSSHQEHMPLTSQTSAPSPSLKSGQTVPSSWTGHSEYRFAPASFVTSATQSSLTISTTSTATATPTQINPNNNPTASSNRVDLPNSSNSNAPLRIILGSVLGGVAFVALALAIGYYYFRSSQRRNSRGAPSPSTSEEDFPAEKTQIMSFSPGASRPGNQSRRSFLSDVSSSVRSLPIHLARVPVSKPDYTYHGPRASAIPRAANTNPFVEPLEFTYKSDSSRGTRIPSNPFADPASSTPHLRQLQTSQPPRPISVAWGGSVSSGGNVSLGSTLILPNGRSSAGSSLLNRLSYPFTVNELSDAGGGEGYYDPAARVSTRSDPFDLEYPAKAAIIHRRSSTVIPVAPL